MRAGGERMSECSHEGDRQRTHSRAGTSESATPALPVRLLRPRSARCADPRECFARLDRYFFAQSVDFPRAYDIINAVTRAERQPQET